ncbi:hypothetical protein WSM22_22510 [Cytophagales bacterium WSM2-2]|nr:hypothetical protein WSM22_22510 [Cytophagales bacterium WSM2-2]
MNKTTFILFLCLAANVYSQKIKVGLRGAVSFANFFDHAAPGSPLPTSFSINPTPAININSSPEYQTHFFKDMQTGFSSGITIEWQALEKWSFETGLSYVQKGIDLKYSYSSNDASGNYTSQFSRDLRINYLVIPVVAKYSLRRFYFLGGLYSAIALNFDIKEASYSWHLKATGSETYGVSYLNSGYVNALDGGLTGGFGYEIPLQGHWSIAVDVRTSLGLVNIPAKYSDTGFLNFTANTKNINFETGLRVSYTLEKQK